MSLTKQNLLFDEADIAGSDQVGAHILGSSSAKVTSTNVGGKEGLDVNVLTNIKNQILATDDREQLITYADFGTKNQRVTQIDYTSDTFPGIIARKTLSYTLVDTRYRRDSINWAIITI